jgi:hypothetical protein
MHHLKWIAVPVAALALMFLFFGVLWVGVMQLAVAAALFAIAATIWRTTAGTWPLAQT